MLCYSSASLHLEVDVSTSKLSQWQTKCWRQPCDSLAPAYQSGVGGGTILLFTCVSEIGWNSYYTGILVQVQTFSFAHKYWGIFCFCWQFGITSWETIGSNWTGWQGPICLCLGFKNMSDSFHIEGCSSTRSYLFSVQQYWHSKSTGIFL